MDASNALFTDLYELTMLHAYVELGMAETATFDLFFRKLPPGRNYLLACGIGSLLDEIEALAFSKDDIAYLATLNLFPKAFLDRLESFHFTGTILAVPEGTPIFPNEPLLEVIAPIGEAQLIETLVLNQIGLQTILASKAARVVKAANGRRVIDFGGRRAQGIDAAIKGARAFYIAGVEATSNVAAGKKYGIPVVGTMAHSFIEACSNESEAFRGFSSVFPETTLLVDTYDTLDGVRRVVSLALALGPQCRIRSVRLDSGNLAELAIEARRILDEAGLERIQIFASGGLDEREIAHILSAGAPIDAFGVGTDMSVSSDAPALDLAYKLVEYAGTGRMKLSAGKRTLPGRKQVFRTFRDGLMDGDVIARDIERLPGTPLLHPVMLNGRRVAPPSPLPDLRKQATTFISSLGAEFLALDEAAHPYPITISESLRKHEQEVRAHVVSTAAR
ncbi:nicotinate phosphoribosyltransferase [Microvirga flavescens]|uniref:nicotinate phosphoribosyltransferase n=1 Tax=Microvirga flavescens TaxID=2249811 RepID=UPI000DD596D1|nr:nicotinate phosphoribosyltransferase [Microvirga flavescens]